MKKQNQVELWLVKQEYSYSFHDISVPMVLASDDEDKENDAVMDKEEVLNL